MHTNDVELLKQFSMQENEMIIHFISLEEDIAKLELMLKNELLHNKEAIECTLLEISTLAVLTRQKVVKLLLEKEYKVLQDDHKNVVTPKEIKELLEDFA